MRGIASKSEKSNALDLRRIDEFESTVRRDILDKKEYVLYHFFDDVINPVWYEAFSLEEEIYLFRQSNERRKDGDRERKRENITTKTNRKEKKKQKLINRDKR